MSGRTKLQVAVNEREGFRNRDHVFVMRFLITKQFHTASRQKRRVLNCCVTWRFSLANCFSSNEMTFKSLIPSFNVGGKAPWDISLERYHNDGGHNRGGHYGGSSKKGGNGAALSALTLLAFLFLLNVMQQSLQDQNSTAPTTTAFLLRETDHLPIILDSKEDKTGKKDDLAYTSTYGSKTATTDYVRVI